MSSSGYFSAPCWIDSDRAFSLARDVTTALVQVLRVDGRYCGTRLTR